MTLACLWASGALRIGAVAFAQSAAAAPDSTAGGELVSALEEAVAKAVATAEPSVVAVARVRRGAGLAPSDPSFVPTEFASGVIVDRRGLILTNYHVLGDPEENEYWVWAEGKPFRVLKVESVQAGDPWLDLAVLKVSADNLRPIAWGDGEKLRKGQFVIALGNPYAIARDGEVSAALGIVSNLRRKAPRPPGRDDRQSLHELGTLIHTDARLELGSSGGALINLRGQMVGLTTALAAVEGHDVEGGFAIPVTNAFKRATEKLAAGQRLDFGYLGVRPAPLSLADRREGRTGAIVEDVYIGTPASKARLRRGDILQKLDGVPIRDPVDLMRLVSERFAGDELQLEVAREGGQVRTQQVRLTKKLPVTARVYSRQAPPVWRGAEVEYLTAMPGFPFHNYKIDPEGCVGLLRVRRDSPAWTAGLREGQYVSHVNGDRASSPDEFLKLVALSEGPVELTLPGASGEPPRRVTVR